MDTAYADRLAAAREHAATMPLDQIDPATVQHFADGVELPYFERLRRDDPVHHAVSPWAGPYWSVTRFQDIMDVGTNPAAFSSSSHDPPAERRPLVVVRCPWKEPKTEKRYGPLTTDH